MHQPCREAMLITAGLVFLSVVGCGTLELEDESDAVEALTDQDPQVRRKAIDAIREDPPAPSKAVPALIRALGDITIRLAAVQALGQYGPQAQAALPDLKKFLHDGNWELRQSAAEAVWRIGGRADEVIPILMPDFQDNLGDALHGAGGVLARMGPSAHETVPVLIEILNANPSQERRALSARILGSIGQKAEPATAALARVSADDGNLLTLREAADEALIKLNATQSLRSVADGPRKRWLPLHHAGQVKAVAFSRNGSLLATGSVLGSNCKIRLWDVKTGVEKTPLSEDYHRAIDYLVFSPDDRTLASSAYGGSVWLWDLAGGRPKELNPHQFGSGSVAFSPDGALLAIAGPDDRTVILWDLKTGGIRGKLMGHKGYLLSVAFAPDGKSLASGSNDGTVRLWDLATTTQLAALAHPVYIETVVYFPDGKRLASANSYGDNTIRIWDVKTRKQQLALQGHTQHIHALACSPDGKTLASGSADATVRLWDVAAGKESDVFKGHRGSVFAVAFSPDGELLASGGSDEMVRIWHVAAAARAPPTQAQLP